MINESMFHYYPQYYTKINLFHKIDEKTMIDDEEIQDAINHFLTTLVDGYRDKNSHLCRYLKIKVIKSYSSEKHVVEVDHSGKAIVAAVNLKLLVSDSGVKSVEISTNPELIERWKPGEWYEALGLCYNCIHCKEEDVGAFGPGGGICIHKCDLHPEFNTNRDGYTNINAERFDKGCSDLVERE